jgi:hypothetical protein
MDRFSKSSSARRIDDYYFPAPHEECLGNHRQAFERARTELISNLEKYIHDAKNISFEDFIASRKRQFR